MKPASSNSANVIVIGAGISGLRTAELIQQAGLSCIILEARNRIGGKILTTNRASRGVSTQSGGVSSSKQEYGAAWINSSTQSHVWKLAQRLGLTTLVQNSDGDVIAEDLDGSLFGFAYGTAPNYPSTEDNEKTLVFREFTVKISTQGILDDEATRKYLDSISLESWIHDTLGGSKRVFATARASVHAMIGCDPGEVSALFFFDYCKASLGMYSIRSDREHGGQYLRIREGTSALVEGIARNLIPGTLRLNMPVTAIQTQASGVEVLVKRAQHRQGSIRYQRFTARRVVISIASPLYRTIDFSPALSIKKRNYVNNTHYSAYHKYLVRFSKAFWRDHGLCGLAQSFIGPVSVFRDTSSNEDSNISLTCFIAGNWSRKWTALSDKDRQKTVLAQISRIFNEGLDVTNLCVETMLSPWMAEEYKGWGCPIPIPPAGNVMSECWDAFVASEGRLHFVGNELATRWRGYMDGALSTAERVSAEVIDMLSQDDVGGSSMRSRL